MRRIRTFTTVMAAATMGLLGPGSGPRGTARAGTVAYWHLNGNGLDAMGDYDLTFETTATGLTGPQAGDPLIDPIPSIGSVNPSSTALSSDYALAYVNPLDTHDSAFDFDPNQSFTVEGWFDVVGGNSSFIVGNRTGNANQSLGGLYKGWSVNVQGGGTQLNFWIDGAAASGHTQNIIANITPNQTHQFAAKWDAGTDQMRLYVDGGLAGTQAGDANWSSHRGGQLSIGGRDDGSGYSGELTDGRIDEIRYSNEALEPSQFLSVSAAQVAVPGAPKASDVIFSTRSPHSDSFPYGSSMAAAAAFHATRFDWVYSTDPTWIQSVVDAGYSYGAAFGPTNIPTQQAMDEGWAAIDYNGDLVTLPRFESSNRYCGDVNDPRYRDYLFDHMKLVIDGGATRIQWDDPAMPIELLPQGGIYNDASITKFDTYLADHSTAAQRDSWGIPDDLTNFNYRDYVADRGGTVNATLGGIWTEFENVSLEDFYQDLQQRISDYAGFYVPFSANNYDGNWGIEDHANSAAGRIYKLFDYGIAELPESDATPSNILLRVHQARELGKAQVFTLVSSDVALNRKVIAYTYAIGSHMVVPWDVYPGNDTDERFYGDPADFADLYGFVRDHAVLYDDYSDLAYAGPDVTDSRYTAITDPVSIHTSSDELYAFLRSKASDPDAPFVVHLVDWADTPTASTVDLENATFGADDDTAMLAQLLLPDGTSQILTGILLSNGFTRFTLPALSPYGLLVIQHGGEVPEPTSLALFAGLLAAGTMRRRRCDASTSRA